MTNIYKKNLYNSWLMLCCSMIKSIISISCILSLHNILVRLFDPIFIIWKLFWLELTQIDLRLAWIGGKLWAGKTLTGRWGFMRQRLPIQDLNQRILITQKIQCIYIYIYWFSCCLEWETVESTIKMCLWMRYLITDQSWWSVRGAVGFLLCK